MYTAIIGDSEKKQVTFFPISVRQMHEDVYLCLFTDKYVYLLNMGGVLVFCLAIIMNMMTSNCQFMKWTILMMNIEITLL